MAIASARLIAVFGSQDILSHIMSRSSSLPVGETVWIEPEGPVMHMEISILVVV